MSAIRPYVEFSIGSMARSARPSRTAAIAPSKVWHDSASSSGNASATAWCE